MANKDLKELRLQDDGTILDLNGMILGKLAMMEPGDCEGCPDEEQLIKEDEKRELAIDAVGKLVVSFLESDRKDDPDLSMEDISWLINDVHALTIEDIVERFEDELRDGLE